VLPPLLILPAHLLFKKNRYILYKAIMMETVGSRTIALHRNTTCRFSNPPGSRGWNDKNVVSDRRTG
jgi:hypothetical protein